MVPFHSLQLWMWDFFEIRIVNSHICKEINVFYKDVYIECLSVRVVWRLVKISLDIYQIRLRACYVEASVLQNSHPNPECTVIYINSGIRENSGSPVYKTLCMFKNPELRFTSEWLNLVTYPSFPSLLPSWRTVLSYWPHLDVSDPIWGADSSHGFHRRSYNWDFRDFP